MQRSLTNASTETFSRVARSSNSSISEFLVHTEPSSTSERSLPRARLLTSDESLAMLEEKENKKKRELEEKEKRKQERAEKKRIREETAKRNKEQRAQKAQERATRQQDG